MGDAPNDLNSAWPQCHKGIAYSDLSTINTLQTCLPRQPSVGDDEHRFWIIYIHGGAWRDPEIDASSFNETQKHLLHSPAIENIAGFASINYRLSPYPSHSTDPSNPADPSRNARHPDHINDVLTAIMHLQETYQFDDRYILVGHSCGATLALQVAMKRYWGEQYESTFANELNLVPPVAIVGVEGIYDIPDLLDEYQHEPAYADFVQNAFGHDDQQWKAASPAKADLSTSWPDGKLVCLIHSEDDELISSRQANQMRDALEQQGWTTSGARRLVTSEVKGLTHDQVWQDGRVLSQCLVNLLATLKSDTT